MRFWIGLWMAGAIAATAQVKEADLRRPEARPGDWLSYGRDPGEARHSPLKQIDAANVKRLGLAWSADMETTRGLEATPIVVNGVMYVTGAWSVVHAYDAATGKRLWRWDPEVAKEFGQKACCDVVNRGVAVLGDNVYVATLDGRLAALNAKTGIPRWQVTTVDQTQPYTITGAPRIVKNKIIIGNGGAEYGVRGYFSAYDAATGKLAWRFYTVPGDPAKGFESPALEKAAKTWTGQWWKYGGGGTVWDSFAYDPELDLLYAGVGNGSPWNWKTRSPGGGDNLYLSSIVAVRPDTGDLVWHYQTTPGDSWDYTATQHMILATLNIGGKPRNVLMQAPKNGFFYVLDRATGELLSAKPYVKVTWAKEIDLKTGRPVEVAAFREQNPALLMFTEPGPLGGHNWHPMSFHPGTGLVYIPAQTGNYPYLRDTDYKHVEGNWNLGILPLPSADPFPATAGALIAWDPVEQKQRWRVEYPSMWNGGVLSTAGNLVFQGTAAAKFVAYSADKGEKLWESPAGAGVIAAPVTYTVKGKQFVSVLAGWGGAFSLIGGSNGQFKAPGRLLTFALDGKETVPVTSEARPKLTPLPLTADQKTIELGSLLYAKWCFVCHGAGAMSGGSLADLRYSSPQVFEAYPKIVLEGSFRGAGMPSLKQWVSEADVAAIRAFVISQRNRAAAAGQ